MTASKQGRIPEQNLEEWLQAMRAKGCAYTWNKGLFNTGQGRLLQAHKGHCNDHSIW